MAEPRITGISIAEAERDRAAGIVARFACVIESMRVRGCALVLNHGGEPLAVLPRCRADSASVRFSDHETRLQVSRAALTAYRAAGGAVPRHDP